MAASFHGAASTPAWPAAADPSRREPLLGVPALDALRPFVPGELTLVLAPAPFLREVEARLVLDAASRGADALLVSGDNRVDAYGLLARARARRLEAAVADGTWLARAFTAHQMAALLEETLPRLAQGRTAGIALATGLLDPYLDEDLDRDEARILLRRGARFLGKWARESGLAVVATTDRDADPRGLATLARGAASRRLEARPHQGGWKVEADPGGEAVLSAAREARQTRLDPARGWA